MNQVERIGRFEVQERLRSNPFAIVYRGRDPFDGHRVHIKFCVATDETVRRRFLVAAERAASLRHADIATVFEFGSGDSKPYLVQEAFSEENLSDLLARGEPTEDVLKLFYLVQIARGLQYAHSREVLHRELRPASVLVDRSGEAKLADFGIARLASAFAQLGNGAHRWPAVGWLLPELILGLELDSRSDIYGFGALAYELLTGKAPFVAESLALLVPQVLETEPRPLGVHWAECPPELDRLVLRCLARDPGQRFSSMNEVVEELGEIVPVEAPADFVEEEKTIVIEDIQTVYVAEPDRLQKKPEEKAAEPVTAEQPAIFPKPRVDWAALGGRLQDWGRATVKGIDAQVRRLASKVRRPAFEDKPRIVISPARLRTAAIVVGALLLSGVVGWGVVRVPDRDLTPLPTVAPERSIAVEEVEMGFLVVDTQPWGEVLEVADQDGKRLSLPADSFTPLPLELPPGRYTVEVSRPEIDKVETCVVIVESASTVRCEPQIAALEIEDFFKQTGWWQ